MEAMAKNQTLSFLKQLHILGMSGTTQALLPSLSDFRTYSFGARVSPMWYCHPTSSFRRRAFPLFSAVTEIGNSQSNIYLVHFVECVFELIPNILMLEDLQFGGGDAIPQSTLPDFTPPSTPDSALSRIPHLDTEVI
jgi:hypothetical protein